MDEAAENYRDLIGKPAEGGTGLSNSKNPAPFCRLFTDKQGMIPLHYGMMRGGDQDISDNVKWVEVYFEADIKWEGEITNGLWKVRITGDSLEPLCQGLFDNTKRTVKKGSQTNSLQPYMVTSVKVEPYTAAQLSE